MAFLFFLFVTVSLTELYLIIEVSGAIGWGFTIGWSLLTGLAGSWLAKQEGRRTMASIQQRMAQMQMPGQELADALLIVISGALLITPGYFPSGEVCIDRELANGSRHVLVSINFINKMRTHLNTPIPLVKQIPGIQLSKERSLTTMKIKTITSKAKLSRSKPFS